MNSAKNLVKLLQYRACVKAKQTGQKIMLDFSRWDELQVYDVREMCEAYYHLYLAQTFYRFWKDEVDDDSVAAMFGRLLHLFLLTKIVSDGIFFRGLVTREDFAQMKRRVQELCTELRPDAMAMTKMLPISDRGVGAFGSEELNPYGRFLSIVRTREGQNERPEWWKAIYQMG